MCDSNEAVAAKKGAPVFTGVSVDHFDTQTTYDAGDYFEIQTDFSDCSFLCEWRFEEKDATTTSFEWYDDTVSTEAHQN